MTIQYKNQGINLTTTGTVSVLTCPSDATILIKQIQINKSTLKFKKIRPLDHKLIIYWNKIK